LDPSGLAPETTCRRLLSVAGTAPNNPTMDSEVFYMNRVELKCAILPSDMSSPMDAVKLQLNEMLLKYNEELQAVPICFSKIEFDAGKNSGRVIAEQPWIHVDLVTSLLLFKPMPGRIIHGVINQISDGHISLLVYGMFNASIAAEEIGKKFKFNYGNQSWESPDGDLAKDDCVKCRIINYNFANGMLSINATLKL
jgi:DNA-directed RNA polymerase subunit E'/Rpb7